MAMCPMGPLLYGGGLNITVFSNGATLDIGVVTCRELVPDPWPLADRFRPPSTSWRQQFCHLAGPRPNLAASVAPGWPGDRPPTADAHPGSCPFAGSRNPPRTAHRTAPARHHLRAHHQGATGCADGGTPPRVGGNRGLNWHVAFEPLSEHFRVIAPDLRGHGRGIRSRRRFRLADCAADVAETLRALDADPAIAVGYSMGGPVAQLLWRDHRDVVSGMVLCATGAEFVPGNRERYAMVALSQILVGTTRIGSLVGWLPGTVVRRVLNVPSGGNSTPMAEWARREMSKHSPRSCSKRARRSPRSAPRIGCTRSTCRPRCW